MANHLLHAMRNLYVRLRPARSRRLDRPLAPSAEVLATRTLLAAANWTGGGDGLSWSDPENWQGGVVPTEEDIVTINAPPSRRIEIRESTTIQSLRSSCTLAVGGGATLRVNGDVINNGVLRGNLTMSSGSRLMGSGTLAALTFDGTGTLAANMTISEGLVVNGRLNLGFNDGPNVHAGRVNIDASMDFRGTGEIVFVTGGGGNPSYISIGGGKTLTIAPGLTVRGADNLWGDDYGAFFGGTLINLGSIVIEQGARIDVATERFSSEGLFRCDGSSSLSTLIDNTGKTFNAAGSGSIRLLDSAVVRGGVVAATATLLSYDRATLDGVTLNGSVIVPSGEVVLANNCEINGLIHANGYSTITSTSDLRLNGRIELGNNLNWNSAVVATLRVIVSQEFSGSGDVFCGNLGGATNNIAISAGMTLTVNEGVRIRGIGGEISGSSGTLINRGAIIAEYDARQFYANRMTVTAATFINYGTLQWHQDSTINIPGEFENHGSLKNESANWNAEFALSPASEFSASTYLSTSARTRAVVHGSILGPTTASSAFVNQGEIRLIGGTTESPQLLEAMSLDRGFRGLSTNSNFYYHSLRIEPASTVRLVDFSDNSPGPQREVLYIGTLTVPSGATLDLNGIQIYTRLPLIAGTVIGGTVTQIPDSGPLATGSWTLGEIEFAGDFDEWEFYGRPGRSVTLRINPTRFEATGVPDSPIEWADVTVLAPDGQVVRTKSNVGQGGPFALDDVPVTQEGVYRIQVRAGTGAVRGRYNLALFDVTADVAPLALGERVQGAVETGLSVDRWRFVASVGQQVRFSLLAKNSNNLVFSLTGPNGFVGFVDASASVDLVTLPADGAYELTARGLSEATGQYSFTLHSITLSELPLGTTISGTSFGTGSAQLYRIQVPEGASLVVRLQDSSDENRQILYAKKGSAPTRSDYEYASVRRPINGVDTADVKGSPSPTLLVPSATPGDWYVLVYGNFAPVVSTFTIRAELTPVVLARATPEGGGANSVASLTLTGTGFKPGALVQLVRPNNSVAATASDVQIDSFTQITATLPLIGVAPGAYSLRVRLPDGATDTLPQSFRVLPGGEARLETRLVMPDALRRHGNATLLVEISNTGTAAMAAPLVRLQSADPDDSDHPLLTLDASRIAPGLWVNGGTAIVPDGFAESVQILASGATPGSLNPGESIQVPVYYIGLRQPYNLSDASIEMELRTFDDANGDAIPWGDLKADLRPATMLPAAWDVVYDNLAENIGETWGDFVGAMSENAQFLNRLGRRVVDVAELWGYEVQQAIGFSPVRTLASAVDAAVTTAGGDLAFGRFYSVALDERFKTSLFGRGWSTPWQTRLEVEADGAVNIHGAGGSRRRFEPDTRQSNKFFSAPGETAVLSRVSNGVYELREQSGSVTRFKSGGLLDYTQDANGNRITAEYTNGWLTRLRHSGGGFLALEYNAAGLVSTLADSAPDSELRQTVFTYDASNQYLLTASSPDGVTSYTYDVTPGSRGQHALTSVTTGGVTQVFRYDSLGRLSATATWLSPSSETGRVTFQYDSAGRVSVTDAGGGTTNLFYDDRGLLARTTDPFGNVTTAEYGDDLRISRIVDPLGRSQAFTWCGCGSLTSSTDQLGHQTTFTNEYVGPNNTLRRMTSFTDANGRTTRYTYDPRGNLLNTIYPNGSIERTAGYDPAGNPLTYINRRGQVMNYEYNARGQVTKQTFDDGTSIELAYDFRWNLVRITEPGSRITRYQYDPADRLTKVTYPEGRFLAYTYDAGGRRATMTDQTGYVVRYSYDAAGRLFQLRDTAEALIVEYLYDAAGRLSRKNNGNNTYTLYQYDLAGQVLSISNRAPSGTVNSSFDYAYDVLGRRTRMTTIDGTWLYGYDATGQLTSARFTPVAGSPIPAQDLQYVYDPLGNRIRTIENGVTTEYTTNNLNQYTIVGQDTLIYDADGNLISRAGPGGNATYSYDQQNRLVRVVTPEGILEFAYDAFGNRTSSSHNGLRSEFLLDAEGIIDVVAEFDQQGAVATRLFHGIGLEASSSDVPDERQYFAADALGSMESTSDHNGSVTERRVYSPFGEKLWQSGEHTSDFGFIGRYGLMQAGDQIIYAGARYYSTELGRFLTKDPLTVATGAMNWYAYSHNDPVLFFDLNGLFESSGGIGEYGRAIRAGVDALNASGGGNPCAAAALQEAARVDLGQRARTAGPALVKDAGMLASSAYQDIYTKTFKPKGARDTSKRRNAVKNVEDWVGWMAGILDANDRNFVGPSGPGNVSGCGMSPPQDTLPPRPPGDQGSQGDSNVTNALDPNEMSAPKGFGTPNFVAKQSALPFAVHFENYGPGSVEHDGTPAPPARWATAPAQRVEITNALSPDFDLETFQLTGFGFGDFNVAIPNAPWHADVVSMTFNGQTFDVWFEAGVDPLTRVLRIVFQSVDPRTELPPEVMTGFLPPEDGTGRGQGFVTYSVRPRAGLTTGTEIRNIALISFDHQPAISTDQIDPLDPSLGVDPARQARVTIDAGLPTATMEPLSSVTRSTNFTLRWSGHDDPGGSGVGSYDVYVSDNGGAFTPFLTNTVETQATFTGLHGHAYAFAVVARDNVGQYEAGRPVAETQTTVDTTVRNQAPVIAGWQGEVVYRENALQVVLDLDAAVSDLDSADFAGGRLVVSIVEGGEAADRLKIRHQGVGARQIGVSGANVTYGGVVIGTVSGGTGRQPLVIQLDADARPTTVQALLRNIAYASVSENPATGPRTVRVLLNDGDGGTSNLPTKTLNIAPLNDRPVLGGIPATQNFVEGSADRVLAPLATVTDLDSADFASGRLTVKYTSGGLGSDRLAIRNQGTAAGQIGVTGSTVSFAGVPIATFTGGRGLQPLVVTFNAAATPTAARAVLRNIVYRNVSDNPTNFGANPMREVRYMLNDGDGGSSTALLQTLHVTPVNDRPVLRGISSPQTYRENNPPQRLTPGATVADPDSLTFNGGKLTVKYVGAGGLGSDRLTVRHKGTGAGQVGVSGDTISVGGLQVATFVGGTGLQPLVITFNADAKPLRVQAVLRSIQYQNVSDNPTNFGTNPSRTVNYVLTDGDGGTSLAVNQTLNITAVNDASVIGNFADAATYTSGAGATILDANATLNDPDSADFAGGNLVLQFANGGVATNRLAIRNQGTGANQIGVSGSNVTFGGTVIGTLNANGGVGLNALIVTFTGEATPGRVQALLRNLTYQSTAANPTGPKTLTLKVRDGDGGLTTVSKTLNIAPALMAAPRSSAAFAAYAEWESAL